MHSNTVSWIVFSIFCQSSPTHPQYSHTILSGIFTFFLCSLLDCCPWLMQPTIGYRSIIEEWIAPIRVLCFVSAVMLCLPNSQYTTEHYLSIRHIHGIVCSMTLNNIYRIPLHGFISNMQYLRRIRERYGRDDKWTITFLNKYILCSLFSNLLFSSFFSTLTYWSPLVQ